MRLFHQFRKVGLVAGPLVFILIRLFFYPEDLTESANAVLAITAWVAIWWVTETLQVEVTALLPIILFPLTGAVSLTETCAAYGHKYIFLFIGGFILAIAIQKWNLHRRMALTILQKLGTNERRVILGFMVSTAFLSMWISNTATTIMMLPIALAINQELNGKSKENNNFGKALMLAIAYSASIGGMATLIGTPPNLIFAGVIEQTYHVELSFFQWFKIGLPVSIGLLLVAWYYLAHHAFKLSDEPHTESNKSVKRQLAELGGWGFEEKLIAAVFCLTAFAWITRSFLLKDIIPGIDDTVIAMTSAMVLFILPAKEKGKKLLLWQDAVKLPWGLLILFGGGIALAVGFQESGLAVWVGQQFDSLVSIHLILIILILVAAVNFLTEITSNMATTSVMLPILAALAVAIGVHPYMLMVACTFAASCAFMLPVATAPNAIVFGSGQITIQDMMKAGIWLNMISIVVITVIVYYVLPLFWNLDPTGFLK